MTEEDAQLFVAAIATEDETTVASIASVFAGVDLMGSTVVVTGSTVTFYSPDVMKERRSYDARTREMAIVNAQ